jgi:hypothetical protein
MTSKLDPGESLCLQALNTATFKVVGAKLHMRFKLFLHFPRCS